MRLPENDLADGPGNAEVVDARQQAVGFLRFGIRRARGRLTGNGYPNVEPAKRAEQWIEARSKGLTARRGAPAQMPRPIAQLNHVLPLWTGYFHHGHGTNAVGSPRTVYSISFSASEELSKLSSETGNCVSGNCRHINRCTLSL
jgi:hypothetical protein